MTDRRHFIGNTAAGLFGLLPLSTALGATDRYVTKKQTVSRGTVGSRYPSSDPEDVRKVVGAAHAQFDVVKELVSARPELAKATYDWGYGDWESALGAASHMGRKDIAEFLIQHGARPNIYTFAMLGQIGSVKAIIEANPGIQKARGPHGFTLMHHAAMRLRRKNVEGEEKERQEDLVAYLEELKDADIQAPALEISENERKVFHGRYVFGESPNDYFVVSDNSRGTLSIARGEDFGRALLRQDENVFAPGGAPSVRIHFSAANGAMSLTIHDPVPVITALRQ